MEMNRTRLQNATDTHSKRNHALDSWWQESAGGDQRDVEKTSGAGDESTRMELVPVTKLAANRKHWRSLVAAICVIRHDED